MFAQVIQGRTSDPDALRAATEQWVEELSPGAVGWLGSTAGVTDDGRVVLVARFESADAARHNSDRPEQGRWWEDARRLFDGEPTFLESDDVVLDLAGDPAEAGFVQVMQGRVSDYERAKKVMTALPADAMAAYRPDVLGTVMIGSGDGGWTQVIYFTSEDEARAGEGKEPPAEMTEAMQEIGSLTVGETTFLDLRRPLLHAPR
jgi:hypothetical protein